MVRLLSVALGALTRSLSHRDVLLGHTDTTPVSRRRGISFGGRRRTGARAGQGRSPCDYGRDRWLPVRRFRHAHHLTTHPRAAPHPRGHPHAAPRPPAPRAAPPPRAPARPRIDPQRSRSHPGAWLIRVVEEDVDARRRWVDEAGEHGSPGRGSMSASPSRLVVAAHPPGLRPRNRNGRASRLGRRRPGSAVFLDDLSS